MIRLKTKRQPVRCKRCHRQLTDPVRVLLRFGRVCETRENAERAARGQGPIQPSKTVLAAVARLLRLRAHRTTPGDGQEPLFANDEQDKDPEE